MRRIAGVVRRRRGRMSGKPAAVTRGCSMRGSLEATPSGRRAWGWGHRAGEPGEYRDGAVRRLDGPSRQDGKRSSPERAPIRSARPPVASRRERVRAARAPGPEPRRRVRPDGKPARTAAREGDRCTRGSSRDAGGGGHARPDGEPAASTPAPGPSDRMGPRAPDGAPRPSRARDRTGSQRLRPGNLAISSGGG